MLSKSIPKSVLLVGLLSGAFLVSSASFAQTAPSAPSTTAKTMPAKSATSTLAVNKTNDACKKKHPDVNGQAYKDCVKDADKVKMK